MDDRLRNETMNQLSITLIEYYMKNGGCPQDILSDVATVLMGLTFLFVDMRRGNPSQYFENLLESVREREKNEEFLDRVKKARSDYGFTEDMNEI